MIPRARMKKSNQRNAIKRIERAACRCSTVPSKPSRLEQDGLCKNPVTIETGAHFRERVYLGRTPAASTKGRPAANETMTPRQGLFTAAPSGQTEFCVIARLAAEALC